VRVVLDTNILISALLVRGTPPDRIYVAWREGRFEMASCERQLEEIRQVSRRPFFRTRLTQRETGRMVNDIRRLSIMADHLPRVTRSPDPADDYLLALATATAADYLVTGDKSGLLRLARHDRSQIVDARRFVAIVG
jgi:uncharacterized protein